MAHSILTIVVTYNAMQWVDRCLSSIRNSSLKADTLVIDNCSSDGTPSYIRERYPWVELFCSPDNQGFGAANNLGLKLALERGYDFVYLLNQDAYLEKDTLEKLVAAYRSEYAVLSPLQKNVSGKLDKGFRKHCGKALKILKGISATDRLIVDVPFVMAAHWMIGREALKVVGGFSPAFRQYGEDENYIDRLHYFGFKAGVVPAASAVHDRAQRKLSRERKIALKCVSAVVGMCRLDRSFFLSRIIEPLHLAGIGVKNFSAAPFREISVLRSRYPELKKFREESRRKGAFL